MSAASPANEPVLSRDELRALVASLRAGKSAADRDAVEVDLAGGEASLTSFVPQVSRAAARFVVGAKQALPFLSRLGARLEPEQADVLPCAALLASVPRPALFCGIEVSPGAGAGLLVLDNALCAAAVEGALGSAGVGGSAAGKRDLSAVERALVGRAAVALVPRLGDALRDEAEVTVTARGFDTRPEMVSLLGPNDPVLWQPLRVTGPGWSGRLMVVLAARALEAIGSRAASPRMKPGQEDQARMRASIEGTEVSLSAVLGRAKLSLRDLVQLRPGAVVRLDRPSGDVIDIECEGEPKLHGTPAVMHGFNAVRVSHRAIAAHAEAAGSASRGGTT